MLVCCSNPSQTGRPILEQRGAGGAGSGELLVSMRLRHFCLSENRTLMMVGPEPASSSSNCTSNRRPPRVVVWSQTSVQQRVVFSSCMLRILGAQIEPPRVLASFPRLLTALKRAHARQATARTPLPLSRGRLTVCASAAAPEAAEQLHDEAMSQQQGSRGGRGPRPPMRSSAPNSGTPSQHHGAANGSGTHGGDARAAAAGNRTSSTTKAHLTNVRFDSLDVSNNTKRCAVMACGYVVTL